MELAAATAAASTAITLLPGDVATPVATEIAQISSYLLIVVCAIYLEKFLITITGYAAFSFLIPIACCLLLLYLYFDQDVLKRLAIKLGIFGIAIYLVIPASIGITKIIDNTYKD